MGHVMECFELPIDNYGAIVLPDRLRARFGVAAGGKVRVDVVGNLLYLTVLGRSVEQSFGALHEYAANFPDSEEEFEEMLAQAMAEDIYARCFPET